MRKYTSRAWSRAWRTAGTWQSGYYYRLVSAHCSKPTTSSRCRQEGDYCLQRRLWEAMTICVVPRVDCTFMVNAASARTVRHLPVRTQSTWF